MASETDQKEIDAKEESQSKHCLLDFFKIIVFLTRLVCVIEEMAKTQYQLQKKPLWLAAPQLIDCL